MNYINQDPRVFDMEIDCPETAEQFDRDLAELVTLATSPIYGFEDPHMAMCAIDNWIRDVQKAAEVMKVWIEESNQDPRSMGWVGQDGRP